MNQGTPSQLADYTKGQMLVLRDKKMAEATVNAEAALQEARKTHLVANEKAQAREANRLAKQAKEIEKLEKSVTLASSGVRNAFDLILASL